MAGLRPISGGLRRSWLERLVLLTGALLTCLCLLSASAVGYVYWKLGKLVHFSDLRVDQAEPEEPKNYLVVGSDSRENIDPDDPDGDAFLGEDGGEGERADTIIVARVDPTAGTVDLVSFPRDLLVTIPGMEGRHRINSAYGEGRQVLIDTIRENFGISIHHYIEVDFRGFQGLVGAVGGVPMYFDTALRDQHTGLLIEETGCVTLDADQALAFVRSRHLQYQDSDGDWRSDPTSDLGRITRQQIFLQRALDRGLDSGLTDPVQLNRLLDVAIDYVRVDAGLDAGDLINLAEQFEQFSGDQLNTHALTVTDERTAQGADVLELDEQAVQPTLNIFQGRPAGSVTEAQVTVSVLNGTGVQGQAGEVSDALDAVGFELGEPGDAGVADVAETTVRFSPGSEIAADLLARHLTSGAALEVDPDLEANELTLVTGADFTTVMANPRRADPSTTFPEAPTTTAGVEGSDDEDAGDGETGDDESEDVAKDEHGFTTTTVVGITSGEAPAGVECG